MLTQEQFEAFYARTAGAFSRYVARIAGDAAIAEEFVQESYLRLLTAPALEDGQLKSYLYRTATNLILDHFRAAARRSRLWNLWSSRRESAAPAFELAGDTQRL